MTKKANFMKKYIYLILFFTFGFTTILIFSGCNAHQKRDSSDIPPTIVTYLTPSKTITSPPIQTATNAILSPTSEEPHFPSLVIKVASINTDGCPSQTEESLFYSTYPYEVLKLLVKDTEGDIYAPSFSPDNKWVAYILSNPIVLSPDDYLSTKDGYEGVEIISPGGTNRQNLGEGLPSKTFKDPMMGCMQDSTILPLITWSPDSQKVVFVEQKFNGKDWKNYNLYLAKIGYPELKLLQNSTSWVQPVWISQDELLLAGNDGLVRLSNIVNGNLINELISFPQEISLNEIGEIYIRPDKSVIMSIIEHDQNLAPTSTNISLWKLSNLYTNLRWEKVAEFGNKYPVLGNKYAAVCEDDENTITIFSTQGWEEVNRLTLPNNLHVECGSLQLKQEENEVAYYIVTDEKRPVFYKTTLDNEKLEAAKVADGNIFNLPISETDYYLDYSVENIP